jgi:DnaJ homolog subfamily A member 2
MAGLAGRGNHEGMDFTDVFAEFFAGGMFNFGAGFGRRTKGQNTVIPYEVTLEDLYNGKNVKMNMEKEVLCSTCKG